MNSLNARESTLQRKGIKAKRANTNVTNAAKIDTRLYPERSQLHTETNFAASVSFFIACFNAIHLLCNIKI